MVGPSNLGRVTRAALLLSIGLYTLLLMVNPVLHDDLACHLKSPAHCSACAASPTASRVEGLGPMRPVLADAGQVEPVGRPARMAAPALTLPGRSPPA